MKKISRRDFIKIGIAAGLVVPNIKKATAGNLAGKAGVEPLTLDASKPVPEVLKDYLKTGTIKNPKGSTLTADSRSLLHDNRPFLPVMGEFHYSRYPETEWRDELLKMKMGGIDIVATYVFWIHHEEIEGRFDWTGQRNLRKFVELCRQVEMPLAMRVGPWCHGEVRNGGFPDWLMGKGWKLRTDDANYLEKVKKLYGEIAAQVKGLFWKDGGNIVTVQLENEFKGKAEHLLTLKKTAVEAGLDAPLYTRTGWTNTSTPMPLGEIVPLYGVYAEGFWDREITPMPGDYKTGFNFWLARTNSAIATDQLGAAARKDEKDVYLYPFFCCEIGGGMMPSYHRRILIYPQDIEATSMIKIGSGNNLQGYYMYHGGTNPEGRLSTLQESQATNYWNDLPVKSYDFQAPLGEFGQINEQYHSLRRMHLFLRDFGSSLAAMPAYLPEKHATDPKDLTTLRWTTRTDGVSGYLFVNNYQRLQPLPPKTDVQFEIKLNGQSLSFPDEPLTVPADESFFMPFNLEINGAKIIYATAQPICRIEDQGETILFFGKIAGIETEIVFENNLSIESTSGKIVKTAERIKIQQLKPGTGKALQIQIAGRKKINFVLLDEKQSLAVWKGKLGNREHIFLTGAGLILDGKDLRLFSENSADLTVSIFPDPHSLKSGGKALKRTPNGIFTRFDMPVIAPNALQITVDEIQKAGEPRQIKNGSKGVAEAPSDADFAKAAVWRLKLPKNIDAGRHFLIRIGYQGDVARLYLGDRLLTDNFYNGNVFEIGLNRYTPEIYQKELTLKILPLGKDAPIYLQDDSQPDFEGQSSVCKLLTAGLIEIYEARFTTV